VIVKDRRKQSIYFPEAMLAEMHRQAERLDRSLSAIAQEAWRKARGQIMSMPGANDAHESIPRKTDANPNAGEGHLRGGGSVRVSGTSTS
jgi:uncharacterized small protein (TIGR04563 family)